MTRALNRRRPKHRRRPVEPVRPVLQLPLADHVDERMREAQPGDKDEEPERGVAVIDFYI